MADVTYAVRVSDEMKEKLQRLADESGQSSKDFFADMVSQFELANARKRVPLLSADIDELMSLTARINHLFVNVGERISHIQETQQHRAANEAKEKETLLQLLQQQLNDLRAEAAERETQTHALLQDIALLKSEREATDQKHAEELSRLQEVNQKNNELLAGQNEKIGTLADLVTQYKPHAEENKRLQQELATAKQEADSLRKEKDKMDLERDRMLLTQREHFNNEMERLRTAYQEKINQLLKLNLP